MAFELQELISSPKLLAEQIDRIGKTELFDLLQEQIRAGVWHLYDIVNEPESFMVILKYLPEEDRVKFLKIEHHQLLIIAEASKKPKLLKSILDLVPEEQHLDLVESKDLLGCSVINQVISHPDSLKLILNVYFKDGQTKLLQDWLCKNERVLVTAASNADCLKMLLDLVDEEQQQELLLKADGILHIEPPNTDSLRLILARVSNKEQLKNLTLKRRDYYSPKTALHCALGNAESLKLLLELIPIEERLGKIRYLNFFNAISDPQCFMTLLDSLPKEQHYDAIKESGPSIFRFLSSQLGLLQSIFEELTIEQIKSLILVYVDNMSALHYAVTYPEGLKWLLGLLSSEDRFGAVHPVYYHSVLHYAAANPEALQVILDSLPKDLQLEAMKAMDKEGRTTLHHAAANDRSLNIILNIIPEEHLLEAIQKKDQMDRPVASYAAPNPKSLTIILDKLPKDQNRKVLKATDKMGRRVWHYAAPNPESLLIIFKQLSSKDRPLLTDYDLDGNTLLDYAKLNPDSLKRIMEASPEAQRLNLLKPNNSTIESVLFKAEEKLDCLTTIFNELSAVQVIEALCIKNKSGDTILHRVAEQHHFLEAILNKQSLAGQLYTPLFCKDKYGATVLHRAADNLHSIKIILKLLSSHYNLFNAVDNYGETVFYKALGKPENLKYLLGQCPQNIRTRLLMLANTAGDTVLHKAIVPESLKILLHEYPQELAMQEKIRLNKNGQSPLSQAVTYPDCLKILLNDFPQQKLYELLGKDDSIIHRALNTPDSLRLIQNHLSEQMFLELLDKQDKEGNRLIHHVRDAQSLKIVLSAYNVKNRLEIICAKNNKNVSFLSSISNRIDLLSAMLTCFPALVDEDGNLVVNKEHLELFLDTDSPLSLIFTDYNIPSALYLLNIRYMLDKFESCLHIKVASTADPLNHSAHDALRNKRIDECEAVLKTRYKEKFNSFKDLSSIEYLLKKDILRKLQAEEKKLGTGRNQDIIDLLDTNNIELLASGENPSLNEYARALLTSMDDVYQIAWRAYDRESPISKDDVWPKYFAGVDTRGKTVSGFVKNESNHIRELVAYLYLSAKDMNDESLVEALIHEIAESSIAHSSRRLMDAPSCYLGTLARLSLATRGNPIFNNEEGESLELSVYVKTQTIVQQLLQEFFTDENRTKAEKELIFTSTFTLDGQQLNDLLTTSPLSQKVISVTGEEYDINDLIKYRVLFLQTIKSRDSLTRIINSLDNEKKVSHDSLSVSYYMYAALFHFSTLRPSLTIAQQKMFLEVDGEAEFDVEKKYDVEGTKKGFKIDTEIVLNTKRDTEIGFKMQSSFDIAAKSTPVSYPKPSSSPKMTMFAPNELERKIALAQHLLCEVFSAHRIPQEIGKHMVSLIINGTISHLADLEKKLQTISPELQDFIKDNLIDNNIIGRALDEVFESIFSASEARSRVKMSPF